jgi:DNA cross-link repair 1C protein
MSTFDGKVVEFPDIRIDYFRADSDPSSSPPLAFFLSHVHSDHLLGLEMKSKIFTYCTPATRDILLRLEKYPHRMNFAKGILETRIQSYRHRKDLMKAIALEVPTEIELAPGRKIQVTAFDANHCVGACMFLIEGDGKAILYTGDIRSEVWWVNSLVRNPILLPYACPSNGESIKRLDSIYLDTTFVVNGTEDPYREFTSKAEGLHELLRKVAQYPSGTNFYFDSWTFGYEDVWQALSGLLDCKVHLDDYRNGLYEALQDSKDHPKAPEAQKMIGYLCGNHDIPGYLTWQQSRLHSCEKGTGCDIWNTGKYRDIII